MMGDFHNKLQSKISGKKGLEKKSELGERAHHCLTNNFLGGDGHALGGQCVFENTKKVVSVNTVQALLKPLDPI